MLGNASSSSMGFTKTPNKIWYEEQSVPFSFLEPQVIMVVHPE